MENSVSIDFSVAELVVISSLFKRNYMNSQLQKNQLTFICRVFAIFASVSAVNLGAVGMAAYTFKTYLKKLNKNAKKWYQI